MINHCFYLDIVVCFALFDPVCGRDGVNYSNSCHAGPGNVHCKGQCPCRGTFTTTTTPKTASEPILRLCPADYDPVCGKDFVNYSNSCEAGSEENVHCKGNCPCRGKPAQRLCLAQYKPVCGSDGLTYSNSCEAGSKEINCKGECPCSLTLD